MDLPICVMVATVEIIHTGCDRFFLRRPDPATTNLYLRCDSDKLTTICFISRVIFVLKIKTLKLQKGWQSPIGVISGNCRGKSKTNPFLSIFPTDITTVVRLSPHKTQLMVRYGTVTIIGKSITCVNKERREKQGKEEQSDTILSHFSHDSTYKIQRYETALYPG